jgi:hypothetical protein
MDIFDQIGVETKGDIFDTLVASKPGMGQQIINAFKPYAGAVESAASQVTNMAALPIAGIAGLAKTITSGPEAGTKTIEELVQALTYQPQTESGEKFNKAAGDIFDLIVGKPAKTLGGYAEKVGGPVAGTAVETAAMLGIPALFGMAGKKGKVKENVKGKELVTERPVDIFDKVAEYRPEPQPQMSPEQFARETGRIERLLPDKTLIEKLDKPEVMSAEGFLKEEPTVLPLPTEPPTNIPGKESRLAIRAEADAIEAKLTEDFGHLAEYKTMSMKEQASKAKAILDGDYEAAKSMAMGKITPPEGVREATMYEAVKIRAIEQGDVELLRSLATESTIPTKLSEYGQAIKAADSRGMVADPVQAMQEVAEARTEVATKTGRKKATPTDLEKLQQQADAAQESFDAHLSGKGVDNILQEPTVKQPGKYGSRNKIVTAEDYSVAKAELSKIFGNQLNVGIDPVAMFNLGKIATYHLEAGARSFASWSAVMVNDLGPKVKPYLEEIWNKTKESFPAEMAKVHLTGITKSVSEGKGLDAIGQQVQQLAKSFVELGVTDRNPLVAKVHDTLKQAMPDITTREVQDAISGYGKYKLLSKDDVMVQLRDIKGQLQQVSKLEDLEARKPPLKTGVERRVPSDEERSLIAKVGDLKREYGIEVTDPDVQLRSSLQALKTRMKNETTKLERQLQDLNLATKERKPIVLDPEATKLRAARDVAKENYKSAVEAMGTVTKEEAAEIVRLSKVTTEAKAAMEQGGDRLTYGAARVAYENYVNDLKGANATIPTLFKNKMAETATTWKDNPAKAIYDVGMSGLRTIADNSVAMVATLDNSFLGRQGLKTLMTHPTVWWPGAKNSFSDFAKTIGGKNAHDALMADVVSRPNYLNGEYQKAKIITSKEEQYPSSFPERIPGVGRVFKASEYAFTGSGLRMRTGLYDLLSDMAKKNGVEPTTANIEGMGRLINSLTARGQWGQKGEGAAVRLVLWAPKMLKGNLDVLTMHGWGVGLPNNFLRQQAVRNITKIIAETATVMMVANAIKPGSAEYDPRSSDFGKINVGTKKDGQRFDITGGAGSIVTLAARMIAGQSKSATTGKIYDYGSGFADRSRFDAFIDFLSNKTNPPASVVRDWLKGKNFGKKDFSLARSVYTASTPITVQQAVQLKDDTSADRLAGVIADALGISSSNPADYSNKRR